MIYQRASRPQPEQASHEAPSLTTTQFPETAREEEQESRVSRRSTINQEKGLICVEYSISLYSSNVLEGKEGTQLVFPCLIN
jgi:hypothetical protein